ncbi:MAG: pilin [Patescibacteria group bacterium]|jgi:uncharacterized BrkB/YihY/UPF0761 family membrane protein
MMRRIILSGFILLVSAQQTLAVGFLPTNDDTGLLNTTASNSLALGKAQPTTVALNLINAGLSLLAAVCVGLLIYAGFLWVWARGNTEEVKKAKDILTGTVLGLIVILASLGITRFVFTTVGNITGATIVNNASE